MIDPWLAASFGVLAMVSSGTGIVVVRRVIQKFGTTSIIVLILGAFIGAAAVIILVSGIMEFEVVDKSHFKMFYNICKREAVSSAAACFM
jgi:drug/metabolite transporter (DMT)-like permease